MDFKSKPQPRVTDRISGLPDAVLCHILSFLVTKYVVRTSLLSTRWKNLWASVPSLYFSEEDFSDSVRFMTFVDHVLFFRHSSNIQKFHLRCSCVVDYSRIYGWIHTAIRCNVVELDLCVELLGGEIFQLPKNLFTCKTLRVLKLTKNFISNTPTSGCFPSLKFLHVTIDGPDKDSMSKFFSCCPVLEDLTIDGSIDPNVTLNVKISAPELKMLRIRLRTDGDYNNSNFFINAPKLENLDVKQDFLSNYFLENAKSLVKVIIDLDDPYASEDFAFGRHVTALLEGVSNVNYLSFSAHRFDVYHMPVFDKLSQLNLVLPDCSYWDLLMELLTRSPNLEHLVIEQKGNSCIDDDSEFEDDSEDEEDSDHEELSKNRRYPPEFVPICLLSQLKTISIREFKGRLDEMEAAKYLLGYGQVLNRMTISTSTGDLLYAKEDLYNEILMFPRCSRSCMVEFI